MTQVIRDLMSHGKFIPGETYFIETEISAFNLN